VNPLTDLILKVGDSGLEGLDWLFAKMGRVGKFCDTWAMSFIAFFVAILLIPFAILNWMRKFLSVVLLLVLISCCSEAKAGVTTYVVRSRNNVWTIQSFTNSGTVTRGLGPMNRVPYNPVYNMRQPYTSYSRGPVVTRGRVAYPAVVPTVKNPKMIYNPYVEQPDEIK
jgi:hypothetical protein